MVRKCMKYTLSYHVMEYLWPVVFHNQHLKKCNLFAKNGVTFNPVNGGTTDFEPLKRSTHLVLRATLHVKWSIPNQADGEVEHRTDIFECPHQHGRSRPPTHPAMGPHTLYLHARPRAHLRIAQYSRKIWPHPIDDCKQMFLSGHLHPSL